MNRAKLRAFGELVPIPEDWSDDDLEAIAASLHEAMDRTGVAGGGHSTRDTWCGIRVGLLAIQLRRRGYRIVHD